MKQQYLKRIRNSHRWYVWPPYLLLTLIVMAPLLAPGYILTLDMIFVPHPPLPYELSSSYAFHALLHFLSFIIPSDLTQKVILCLIVFLSAVGTHRLVEQLKPDEQGDSWQYMPYIAGLLYAINPFVYDRFMAGQYSVLLGYALVPCFVRSLFRFFDKPSFHSSLPMILWTILISIVSVHTLGILLLITVVTAIVIAWKYRKDTKRLTKTGTYSLLVVIVVAFLSSYWLLPALLGHGPIADAVSGFSPVQVQAFAAHGGLLNILQLHGFWAESLGLFEPADHMSVISGICQLVLWVMILIGVVVAWRRQRTFAIIFGTSAIIAVIVAVGIFQTFLAAHIPLFAGYREPHKFTMVIALSYAYFGAWGTYSILEKRQKNKPLQMTIFGLILLLPVLVTPSIFWGLNGQLRPQDYPQDWYRLNNSFPAHSGKTLFLPWHLYMRFSFAGGRMLASPADQFFADKQIIVSNDPEFDGVASLSRNPLKQKLSQLLSDNPTHTLTAQELYNLDIAYVMIAREGDGDNYDYLNHMPGLEPVYVSPVIKLYKVTQP